MIQLGLIDLKGNALKVIFYQISSKYRIASINIRLAFRIKLKKINGHKRCMEHLFLE